MLAPPADPELDPPLLEELPEPELLPAPELLLPLEGAPELDPLDVEPEPPFEAPLDPASSPPAGDPLELEQALLTADAEASRASEAIDPSREEMRERSCVRRGRVAMVGQ